MTRVLLVAALTSSLTAGCVIDLTPVDEDVQQSTTGTDGTDGTDQTDGTGVGTDDTDTTGGALQCALPYPCRTEGPCAGLVPECVEGEDGKWTWDCGYDQIDGFVQNEGDAHCDNVDNDCDGVVDDIPARASDPANCTQGVCEGAPSRCAAGTWTCDYSDVAGYEKQEETCDALDNDCDGETDEGVGGTAADCAAAGKPLLGICATLTNVQCGSNGSLNCDHTLYLDQLPLYSAQDNTCDTLDNDCDGLVDEDADETSAASPCKTSGPCSGAATATCTPQGTWECDYAAVPAYEDVETACDGLDNDCDGQTDTGALLALSTEDCTDNRLGVGVCAGGAVALCVGGDTVCTFDNVPGYEAVELSCDGKDNDCDGQTDEELTPPVGTCSTLGVCKTGLTATCTALGTWECSYGSPDWQPGAETLCDGKDNDCDGLVDEDITASQDSCPGSDQGVCKGYPATAICVGNKFSCSFQGAPGYEPVEVSCDGKDNDCDGLTDEDLHSVAASTCKKVGVCANTLKIAATCNQGTWSCDYAQLAPGYEEDESTCDGKDNDCDGLIDENIVADGADVCPPGVCSTAGQAVCQNGEFICDKASAVGFENKEVSCDGKDNDCDGETDEKTCPLGTQCGTANVCTSGACNPSPLGDAGPRCCASSANRCPGVDCEGEFADGQRTCLQISDDGQSNWYRPQCVSGQWQLDLFDDVCESGACENGECKTCAPGGITCAPSETALLQCDANGDTQTEVGCPTSPAVTSCVVGFPGVCLYHQDQKVDTNPPGDDAFGPAIVRTTGSTYRVAWQNKSPAGYAISSRQVNDIGALTNQKDTPHSFSVDGRAVSMARLSVQRTVMAWHQINGGDTTVYARLLIPTGGFSGAATQVNGVSEFEQSTPSVIANTDEGFVIAFQGAYAGVGNGLDVHARAYNVVSGSSLVSTQTEVRLNEYTKGTQRRPVGARHASGTVFLAWESQDQALPGHYALYGRIVTTASNLRSLNLGDAPFQLHANADGDHLNAAITATADGFVAVWQSDEAGSFDIYMRAYDSLGTPLGPEKLVTATNTGAPTPDDQRRPDVVTTLDGSIVVAWDDVTGDGSLGAVFLRQFRPDLTPVGPEARRVNLGTNFVIGDQRNPSLAPAGDAARPWVVVAYEDGSGNGANPPVPSVVVRPMILQEW